MKKILIPLLVLFGYTNIFSQDSFIIGLKTGGSIFNFHTKANLNKKSLPNIYNFNENSKPGISFGVFSRIHIWEIISLQPEAYFSKKSSESTFNYLIPDGEHAFLWETNKNTTIYSIDIPVLIHVKAVDLPSGNIYAIAGFALTYITKDEYDLSLNIGGIGDADIEADFENAIKNDFEKTNYSFQAGVGYEVSKFNLDLRYESVFNEMSKSNFEMKTSALMLNIGLKFF